MTQKTNNAMSKETRKKFTVQGGDTPVPVGADGATAGHPRPSSNDCSDVLAADQAGTSRTDTGTRKEVMISEVLGQILKKPVIKLKMGELGGGRPRSEPCSPTNVANYDLTWCEKEARSVERRKGEGLAGNEPADGEGRRKSLIAMEGEERNREERLGTMIRKNLKEINKYILALASLARERNTKKEIKEISAQLRSLVSQITTNEANELLQKLGSKRTSSVNKVEETKAAETQTEVETKVERIIEEKDKEIGALKKEIEKLKKELRKAEGKKEEIAEEQLTNVSYEHFVKLKHMDWPEGFFKAAFLTEGLPLRAKNSDLLVLEEEEKRQQVNQGCRRIFYERFPELNELEGGLAALTVRTGVQGPDGKRIERERWIIRAEVGEEEEVWFETLVRLGNMLKEGSREKIALYPPGQDESGAVTRRMLELIFRGSNIKCIVYVRKGERAETGNEEDRHSRPRRQRTEALILQREGKSYADLLKEVKEKVKPGTGAAKAIRTIRQARDGNLVMVLEGKNVGQEEELRKKLGTIHELKIKKGAGEGEGTLFINDIDGVTTGEEVLQAVCQETGVAREKVRIGDMRPSYGGNQRTFVTIPKQKAEELSRKGGIRIGLSWCLVKERVEVVRCFRCWNYGHYETECTEKVDSSKLCRKCGEKGHLAKDCKGKERCLTCKEEGHVAGSGRCPEFRKALARERQRIKKKR